MDYEKNNEENEEENVEYYANFSTPQPSQAPTTSAGWITFGVIGGIVLIVVGLYVYQLYKDRQLTRAIQNRQTNII